MEMSPEKWLQLKELFRAAIECVPRERAAFLDRAFMDAPDLRSELESLLASHDGAENFIETPVLDANIKALAESHPEAIKGQRIGAYQLICELGRGGMGTVYLAERADEQYQKLVAIKVVRRGMDSEDILRRFRNERQILASLDHPNIARLLDGGTTDDGRPFLVMEYVAGTPVIEYCDTHRLTTTERLQLFRTLCAAVQHAHQNLVVHRDLKPSNILITSDGVPKLLDFGIAKVLNPELSTALSMERTLTELRVLTPDYASPEHVRGERLTTTSDVYSLGIVLYELLTGHRPYRSVNKPPHEFARLICEQEPAKPSTAVNRVEVITRDESKSQTTITPESISQARDTEPDKLRRRLSGDLDNIVLMALRKAPQRRYESAAQFSADIQRHLSGLPVIARKDTFGYRAGKFLGRHKGGVAAAAIIILAVLVGLTASIWQARVAARERDQARLEKVKAEQLNKFLQSILSAASPEEKGKDATVIEVLNDAAQRIDTEFANQPELKGQALLTIGQTYNQLGLTEEGEKVLREALKINTELYGAENESTALSMINLSVPLLNKGDLAEAELMLNKGINIERNLYPSGSKGLAYALFVLGELHVRRGEYDQAPPLLQEALSMSDRISGEQSEDSAFILVSIGRAQQFSGDLAGAEATYRKSIAIFRQLPPRFEIRMALAIDNLGRLLMDEGNYEEAIKTLLEADQISQKVGESLYLFNSKDYLCVVYFNKGDYGKAIEEGERAVEIGRKNKLEGNSNFIEALTYLGWSLNRSGKATAAEPYLREAFDEARKNLPQGNLRTALAEGALGECLTAQKRYNEAEPLLLESYESLKNSQAANSPQVRSALQRLVTLYENGGQPDKAARYRSQL